MFAVIVLVGAAFAGRLNHASDHFRRQTPVFSGSAPGSAKSHLGRAQPEPSAPAFGRNGGQRHLQPRPGFSRSARLALPSAALDPFALRRFAKPENPTGRVRRRYSDYRAGAQFERRVPSKCSANRARSTRCGTRTDSPTTTDRLPGLCRGFLRSRRFCPGRPRLP